MVEAFRESLPNFGKPRPELTFSDAFRETVGNSIYVTAIPVFVLLVFLVRRTMFAVWPKACLWLAVFVLGPSAMLSFALSSDAGSVLPNLALGAGLIWLNYEVGKLVLWRLSRPIAHDVARSELEIPYRVPGSRARLRVKRDRLVLDRLSGQPKGTVHKTILWPELTGVRVEHVTTPVTWQASAGTAVTVPEGPALCMTSAGENWLLPVTEQLGEDLAAAITLRANAQRSAEQIG